MDDLSFILSILGSIVLPVLLWWYTPKYVCERIKYILSLMSKDIDSENLKQDLEKAHLRVSNDASISVKQFILLNRYVYFPVVPKANLSIIHLTFINRIKHLKKLGLKLKIFVFDEYYMRAIKGELHSSRIDIDNFVNELVSRGIDPVDIILESTINGNKRIARKVLRRVLDLSAMVTIQDMIEIKRETAPYVKDEHSYIKFQKILFNMAYASVFSEIGFVLAGEDEIFMWQKFVELEKMRDSVSISSRIIILSIDKMKNMKGKVSSIWDEGNLCTDKDIGIVKQKIRENCSNISLIDDSCGIFYLLRNVYFVNDNKRLELKIGARSLMVYNIGDLVNYCKQYYNQSEELEDIVNSLSDIVYKILHNKV